jgi:hypothetical protein
VSERRGLTSMKRSRERWMDERCAERRTGNMMDAAGYVSQRVRRDARGRVAEAARASG